MKAALTGIYLAAALFAGVQALWNERQVEYREKQLSHNARLNEIAFDLARRVKEIETKVGLEWPRGESGKLPRLPVLPIPDRNVEPGFAKE